MKVNLTAVLGFNPAELQVPLERDYVPVRRSFAPLDLSAHAPGVIFESTAGCIECVPNGDVGILVRVVLVGGAAYDNVLARNAHIHTNAVKVSLMAAPMGDFDEHATTDDPAREFLQFVDPTPNLRFDRVAWGHPSKRNLKRPIHPFQPCDPCAR